MSNDLTDEQLAELERLEQAATKGPFSAHDRGIGGEIYTHVREADGSRLNDGFRETFAYADSEYIAALLNAAPALLAAARERDALKAEVGRLVLQNGDIALDAMRTKRETTAEIRRLHQENEELREDKARLIETAQEGIEGMRKARQFGERLKAENAELRQGLTRVRDWIAEKSAWSPDLNAKRIPVGCGAAGEIRAIDALLSRVRDAQPPAQATGDADTQVRPDEPEEA